MAISFPFARSVVAGSFLSTAVALSLFVSVSASVSVSVSVLASSVSIDIHAVAVTAVLAMDGLRLAHDGPAKLVSFRFRLRFFSSRIFLPSVGSRGGGRLSFVLVPFRVPPAPVVVVVVALFLVLRLLLQFPTKQFFLHACFFVVLCAVLVVIVVVVVVVDVVVDVDVATAAKAAILSGSHGVGCELYIT